jgi:hypothetical protein
VIRFGSDRKDYTAQHRAFSDSDVGLYWAKGDNWTGIASLTIERYREGHVHTPKIVWTWHNTGRVFTPTAIGPKVPYPKDEQFEVLE